MDGEISPRAASGRLACLDAAVSCEIAGSPSLRLGGFAHTPHGARVGSLRGGLRLVSRDEELPVVSPIRFGRGGTAGVTCSACSRSASRSAAQAAGIALVLAGGAGQPRQRSVQLRSSAVRGEDAAMTIQGAWLLVGGAVIAEVSAALLLRYSEALVSHPRCWPSVRSAPHSIW